MKRVHHGLTLIEIAIALALVAFLATVALPAYRGHATRQIVAEVIDLADPAKSTVDEFVAASGRLPAAKEIAMPFVNSPYVRLMSWASAGNAGTITIGTRSGASGEQGALEGKDLVLTASFNPATQRVDWVCGRTAATTVEGAHLIDGCK